MASYDESKQDILSANVSNTGAATNKEIVAADTDERLIIRKLIFTSSASAAFTLKQGSTTLLGPTKAITSLVIDDPRSLVSAINANFNYTTDAGNSNVWIEYFKSGR